MDFTKLPNIPLEAVEFDGIDCQMLRLDAIHPMVSGNKFFKLKYNVQQAIQEGSNQLLTFGGAYSNHIHATAYACHQAGLKSIGIIRGERAEQLSPTLQDAKKWGMHLHFISRAVYREKTNVHLLEAWEKQFGSFYLVPEGGSNELAMKGCMEINTFIPDEIAHIFIAAGTGTTAAGIIAKLKSHQKAWVVSVLKGDFLKEAFQEKSAVDSKWELLTQYHFGGYAKCPKPLIEWMNTFYEATKIPTDAIYTAKLTFAAMDIIKKHQLEGKRCLIIHSGGLQGNRGIKDRLKRSIIF